MTIKWLEGGPQNAKLQVNLDPGNASMVKDPVTSREDFYGMIPSCLELFPEVYCCILLLINIQGPFQVNPKPISTSRGMLGARYVWP